MRGTIQSDMYLTAEQTQMLEKNIPLVKVIAKDYVYQLDFDTLYSEGLIALVFAIRKFDVNNGAKFSTYAGIWIRKRMRDAITLANRPLRGSTETNQMVAMDELFGDDATESAHDYSCTLDTKSADSNELTDLIKELIDDAGLTEIEKEVLNNQYGLDGNKEATLAEISAFMTYTPSAIKAISERAKRKIREAMNWSVQEEILSTHFLTT